MFRGIAIIFVMITCLAVSLGMAVGEGLPSEPRDVEAKGELGQVTITWSPPVDTGGSDILGYNISRGPDGRSLESIVSLDPDKRSFVDTDVVNGTEYAYGITAFSANGTGIRVIVRATPYGPPPVPYITSFTALEDGWRLNWEMPENDGGGPIFEYLFYQTTDPEFWGPPVQQLDFTPFTGMSTTGLDAGKTYYVKMAWSNTHGTSDPTETFVFNVTAKPEEPYNLEVTRTDEGVRLRWVIPYDNGLPITSFEIDRYSDRRWTRLATLDPSVAVYVDKNITEDGKYSYRVRAVNDKGPSDPSDPVEVEWKAPEEGGSDAPGPGIIAALVAVLIIAILVRKRN